MLPFKVHPSCPPPFPVQLPVLKDLQRVIDEVAFGVNACQPVATPARLIVEQVGGGRALVLQKLSSRAAEWHVN